MYELRLSPIRADGFVDTESATRAGLMPADSFKVGRLGCQIDTRNLQVLGVSIGVEKSLSRGSTGI